MTTRFVRAVAALAVSASPTHAALTYIVATLEGPAEFGEGGVLDLARPDGSIQSRTELIAGSYTLTLRATSSIHSNQGDDGSRALQRLGVEIGFENAALIELNGVRGSTVAIAGCATITGDLQFENSATLVDSLNTPASCSTGGGWATLLTRTAWRASGPAVVVRTSVSAEFYRGGLDFATAYGYGTFEYRFTVGSPIAGSGDAGPTLVIGALEPADLNLDRVVDASDIHVLVARWGTFDPDADLNLDGMVDGADLGLLLGQWGESSGMALDRLPGIDLQAKQDASRCGQHATRLEDESGEVTR